LLLPAKAKKAMVQRTILVAGALGVIGRALVEHCEDKPDVEVIGLARRTPEFQTRAAFRSVNLLDRADCEGQLSDLRNTTHIVYAAWQPQTTRQAEVGPNLAMLRNLMEVVGENAPGLRHATLLQGAKAYGSHLGPFRTPARETDPRHIPPNFYYDQEDYLAELQRHRNWTWTIFRPTFVYGFAVGNPMNLATVIAVYAAISKELGLPLRFPGTEKAYRVLSQAVDAALIARAIMWAGDNARCSNEIFNITNGDLFRWSNMWPYLGEILDMPISESQRIPLAEFMSGQEPVWDRMVKRYGLKPYRYRDIASWDFGESSFNREYDHILDTTHLRDLGFDGYEDSYRMFKRQLQLLRAHHIVP
jgi:nucleoside-diphosphate-sugar epimerase